MDKETIIYLDGFADGLNMANNSTNKMLDKIRTEISTVYESLDGYDPDSLGHFLSEIDKILDRYKAEIEPQESEE